jgi:hypothetical protein
MGLKTSWMQHKRIKNVLASVETAVDAADE